MNNSELTEIEMREQLKTIIASLKVLAVVLGYIAGMVTLIFYNTPM